ncbi:hypothetical protein HPB48_017665 [Haemaphysalis longicornis]|uniref:Uncharacterized protein n=1 Tax=Haemaphysalis longicornis TaxID=44386 RepID=A0A9J6GNC1_HAELO|nr:hypothetical protein HPB48_017665 [Haemaphysalis longicornis]
MGEGFPRRELDWALNSCADSEVNNMYTPCAPPAAGERSRAALHRRERDWRPVASCGRGALSRCGQCGVVSEPHSASSAPRLSSGSCLARAGRQPPPATGHRSLAGHSSVATRDLHLSSALAVIIPAGWLLKPHFLLAGTAPFTELLSRRYGEVVPALVPTIFLS